MSGVRVCVCVSECRSWISVMSVHSYFYAGVFKGITNGKHLSSLTGHLNWLLMAEATNVCVCLCVYKCVCVYECV